MSSPYAPRVIENYTRKPFERAESFYVFIDGSLKEVVGTYYKLYYGMNEEKYYKYVSWHLPRCEIVEIEP